MKVYINYMAIHFAVKCYPRFDDAINATIIQTSDLSATFKKLRPGTDYAIQVRAKTTRGWGEYTPVIFKKTPQAMGLGKSTYNKSNILFFLFIFTSFT